jgi:hypothetical protein
VFDFRNLGEIADDNHINSIYVSPRSLKWQLRQQKPLFLQNTPNSFPNIFDIIYNSTKGHTSDPTSAAVADLSS